MQILSLKTKLIFENDNDKARVFSMLETEKQIWNWVSQQHFRVNEKGYLSCKNSDKELHHKCYYPAKQLWPQAKVQVIIKAITGCLSTYRSIKSNKHKMVKPAIKKKMSMSLDHNLIQFKDGIFRITTEGKRAKAKPILYPRFSEFLEKYKFGDPKIFVRDGELWLALSFKIEEPTTNPTLALGVDIGVCRFAATSEGKIFKCELHNKLKRKIRYLKRTLYAKGSKSARKHIRKLSHKETNLNKNFYHHLTNSVIESTQANVIVVEDLEVKNLKKKKCKENPNESKNRISQVCLGTMLFLISYKARLSGKSVIKVNPAYTSQTDHITGRREGKRCGRRFYAQGRYNRKGLVYDSDVNAAVNIAKLSNLPVSCSNVLDGQAIVTRPNVYKSNQVSYLG